MAHPSAAGAEQSLSAGTELYSLCQSVAPDGKLSALELERLKAWLARGTECDVPAPHFIRKWIGHVLETGIVMPGDFDALVKVLEPSLPPMLRRRTTLRVIEGDADLAFDDGTVRRARNGVLAYACFVVARCGSTRSAPRIPRGARAGEPVLLAVEAARDGSGSTVAVRTAHGRRLGYVPAPRARQLAPLLARGARYRAHLIMVASGVHVPVLVVQAFVYRGDAALGFAQASARRIAPRRLSPFWWMLVRAAVGLAIAAAAALALRT